MRRLLSPLSAFFLIVGSVVAPTSAGAQNARDALPVEIVPTTGMIVNSVAFSPDGKRVLAGGGKSARLWDTSSGRVVRYLVGHSDTISSIAYSPDGMRVLSGSWDKTAKLWNASTGRLIYSFDHAEWVESVAFSPDGARILTGSQENSAKLWDASTGRLLRTFSGHSMSVTSVAFSPDGTRLLTAAGDKTAKLWDVATGRLLRTFAVLSGKGIGHDVHAAFSPDGSRMVSAAGHASPQLDFDRTIKIWDLATGQVVRTFAGHSDTIKAVAFSPDGNHVLSSSRDKTIKLWEVASGRLVQTFEDADADIRSIAFSPDGAHVLSGSSFKMKLWDKSTGQPLRTFAATAEGQATLAYLPQGIRVLSASRDQKGAVTATLWEPTSGKALGRFSGLGRYVLSADGSRMLSRTQENKGFHLWNTATGRLLHTFAGPSEYVRAAALSPDATRVLTATNGKAVKLWDVASGQLLRTFEGHSGNADSLAFSPDGTKALSGGGYKDNAVKLWDLASGQLLRTFTGHSYIIHAVAFSPDGTKALSGGGFLDRTAKLWDVASGRLLRTFQGHAGSIDALAFSADGARALTGSEDRTARLWDLGTGQLLRTFTGHLETVNSVAFSPDGRRVLTASNDSTVKLWDADTAKPIVSFMTAPNGEWLLITPEGFFDASAKGADLLSVVRGFEVYSIDQVYQALYRPDLVREKLAGDPKGLVREAAAKLDLDKVMASGAAPEARIIAPAPGASLKEDQVVAEAEIADRGGGIGKVEWRLNGVTLGVDTRGLIRVDRPAAAASADKLTVRQTFALDAGENVIEVVAYNAKGLIASTPVAVKVTREGAQLASAVRLHVLAVGINDYYDSRLRLNFAVPDARAIGAALAQAGKTIYEQVSVTTVIDDEVKRDKLDAVFAELAGKVRPSDVFVFFIAGHGKTVDGRYHFIPQDFRYEGERSIIERGIDQEQWQAWFARIAARKSVLLFDTCESGSLTADRVALRGLEHAAALERLTRAMGRTVLSASTDDAPAIEGYRGHGLFTYTILDALERADADGNGLIDVTELAGYVDAQVPVLSERLFKHRQVPQMKIVGSNYPLVKLTAVLGEASSEPIILRKPSHVVVQAADVFPKPAAGAERVLRLAPGTQVTLVRTEAGWTLIARDGKTLGYVAATDLAPLQ